MKLFNLVSLITIIAFNLLVLVFLFWLLYPYKTITFNTPEHSVETKIVKSGGYLVYDVSYCKYTNVVPTITRYFVDGITYLVSNNEVAIKKEKGCGVNKVQVYVPKGLPKGDYKFQVIFHYKVNPIRTIDVVSYTESFTIE